MDSLYSLHIVEFFLCFRWQVDRRSVPFPRYQEFITKKRYYRAITAVWLISLPSTFLMMIANNELNNFHCAELCGFFFTSLKFLFSVFVVTLCYIFIFKAVRVQYGREKKKNGNSNDHKLRADKNFQSHKNSWTRFECLYHKMLALFNPDYCKLSLSYKSV